MTIAHRGTKRRCTSCGAPFYDLEREPVVCPKCHAPYVAMARVPVKAVRTRPVETLPVIEEEEAAPFEEDDVLEHADEDEDGLPPDETDTPGREDDESRD